MEDYEEEDFTIVGMAEEDTTQDELDIIPMNKKPEIQEEKQDNVQIVDGFKISGNVSDDVQEVVEDNGIQDDEILKELNRYKKANNLRTEQAINKINKYYQKRKLYMKRRWMLGFVVVTIILMFILSGMIT